jgi:hypothetical protein
MTILESNIKLFGWFQEHHCFEPEKNTLELLVVSDCPEEDKAAVHCSLKELEAMGCISSHVIEDKTYYILKKDFSSAAEQKIEVSGYTADALAGCLNYFCEKIGDFKDQCDPANIQEKDVRNAVLIMQHYYKIEENLSPKESGDLPPFPFSEEELD